MPSPHLDLDPKSWETVRLHDVICAIEEFMRGLRGGKPVLNLDCMEEFLDNYATFKCDHTLSGNEHVDLVTIKLFFALNHSYLERIVDEYGCEILCIKYPLASFLRSLRHPRHPLLASSLL